MTTITKQNDKIPVSYDQLVINSHIEKAMDDFNNEKITRVYTIKEVFKRQVKENLLLISTVLAVLIGIGLAFILRAYTDLNPATKAYFGFPGDIFLRMLKFLILPLVGSSLISGVAGLGTAGTGKVAGRSLLYYFVTTLLAVILGIVLVVSIKPGKRNMAQNSEELIDPLDNQKITTVDTILDLIRNLFPDNMVEMTFSQYQTKLIPINRTINETDSFGNIANSTSELYYWAARPTSRNGLNVLGLIMFCFVFGIVIGRMGEQGKILINFFEALNEASIRMIGLVMIYSPIGICSLICAAVLQMDRPDVVFQRISYYMLTVLVGLAIHALVVLPIIFIVITRANIFRYTKNMMEALLIALATSSSSATLPVTFRCIEEKNKIHKMISRFVLPVGATVNMDGTALYEAVAAIFIAQINNKSLQFVDLVVTSITATLASIGAAGVPSAGLVTMVIVLSALNLPQNQISLIYAVDWLLDRFRTMVNVWGDSIGAAVVAKLSVKEIEEYERAVRAQPGDTSDGNTNKGFTDSDNANITVF